MAGSWTTTTNLDPAEERPEGHTATLLSDGKVLLLGAATTGEQAEENTWDA